jgi:hypothetical protein
MFNKIFKKAIVKLWLFLYLLKYMFMYEESNFIMVNY